VEMTSTTAARGALERVAQRLRPRFARAEMRVRCRRYLHGLLGEVRRWDGWHRHVTLCLLAHAILAVPRAAAKGGCR
jgi:SRSO17 transposase